jgi:hypothetical protein
MRNMKTIDFEKMKIELNQIKNKHNEYTEGKNRKLIEYFFYFILKNKLFNFF